MHCGQHNPDLFWHDRDGWQTLLLGEFFMTKNNNVLQKVRSDKSSSVSLDWAIVICLIAAVFASVIVAVGNIFTNEVYRSWYDLRGFE